MNFGITLKLSLVGASYFLMRAGNQNKIIPTSPHLQRVVPLTIHH